MRNICAALMAVALVSSSAFAASGDLAPGKPAGIHQAQTGPQVMTIIGGVAFAGMILAMTGGGGGGGGGASNNQPGGGGGITSTTP